MDQQKEAFVRWQKVRIEQFSFLNNLLTGLAAAMISLVVSSIPEKLAPSAYFQITAIKAAVALLFFSMSTGLILAWNRLLDFRVSAEISKSSGDVENSELRKESSNYGRVSWILLPTQGISFWLGSLLLFASFCYRFN